MEHFDDMLRNTMANDYPDQRFEFREEYWLQAQALIESYERKRRRRVIFWTTITTLVVAGGVLLYFYGPVQTPVREAEPASLPAVPSPNTPAANPDAPAESSPVVPVISSPASTSPMADASHTQAENTGSGAVITAQKETDQKNSKDYRFERNHEPIAENNHPIPAIPEGSSQETALQHRTDAPGITTEVAQQSTTTSLQSSVTSVPAKPHYSSELPVITSPGTINFVKSTGETPVPVLAVSVPEQKPVLTGASMTKVNKSRHLHIGVVATAGTYSGVFQKEQPTIGLGLTSRFALNDFWSVNADLNWKRWKGEAPATATALLPQQQLDGVYTQDVVRTYSFGYAQTRTSISLKAIHFVELPVYVERRFHQLAVEAGLQLNYLAFNRFAQEAYASESLSPAEQSVSSSSYYAFNQEDFIKTFIPGVLAGVSYQPFRHFSIGIRGGWRPVEKAYASSYALASPEAESNRSLRPLSSEIRVKWLF